MGRGQKGIIGEIKGLGERVRVEGEATNENHTLTSVQIKGEYDIIPQTMANLDG